MNKYQKQYKNFNIKENNSDTYKSAEDFARNFKKCTVFEFKRTKSSANTVSIKKR